MATDLETKPIGDLTVKTPLDGTDRLIVSSATSNLLQTTSLNAIAAVVNTGPASDIAAIASSVALLSTSLENWKTQIAGQLPRVYPQRNTGDDATAIQTAVNTASALSPKGGVVDLGSYKWTPNKSITVNPVRCSIVADSAYIDQTTRTYYPLGANISPDPNFGNSSAWVVRSDNTGPGWAFDGSGHIIAAPTTGTATDNFSVIVTNTAIPLTNGSRYRLTATIDQVVNFDSQHYVTISLRNSTSATSSVLPSSGKTVTAAGTYVWEFQSAATEGYLTIQTSNGATVSSVTVQEVPDNYTFILRTPAGANGGEVHGHHFRRWGGFKIMGPNDANSVAFFHSTLIEGFSSRVNMYDVDVEGIGTIHLFAERSYLSNFHGCRFRASTTTGKSFHFLSGMPDAGENFNMHGGNVGGGGWGVLNEGSADMNFFGVSFDFCDRFYEGNGNVTFAGCHLEKHPVASNSLTDCPFIINGGSVTILGGKIMISGGGEVLPASRPPYVFYMPNKGSWVKGWAVSSYMLTSSTGEMAGPVGRIDWNSIGGADKTLAPIAHADPRSTITGEGGLFVRSTVQSNIDCYCYGGTQTSKLVSQYGTIALDGSDFHTAANSLAFTKTATSTSFPRMRILVPFPRDRIMGYRYWWKITNGSKAAAWNVWMEGNFVQVMDRDSMGIPIIGNTDYFTQFALNVPASTATVDWTKQENNTDRYDDSIARDGWSPPWTTHVMFEFTMYDAPSGAILKLDDFIVTAM